MPITRRRFLKGGLAVAALGTMGATMPSVMVRSLYAANAAPSPGVRGAQVAGPRTLVVLQLGGGNDGLGALPPYTSGAYHDLRPQLGLDESDGVVPIAEGLGLHPSLASLKGRWQSGQMAIVQNVGYPEPDRSHFRSMAVWQTAQPAEAIEEGWLGRYLDFSAESAGDQWRAVGVDPAPAPALRGGPFVPAVESIDSYTLQADPFYPGDQQARIVAWQALHAAAGARTGSLPLLSQTGLAAFESMESLQAVAGDYTPLVAYPSGNALAAAFQTVAQLIDADLGTNIAYVTLGGFDTHAGQEDEHGPLLANVAAALNAFLDDLAAQGRLDQVAVMAFSEFGRRAGENGSGGTDHGKAGPVFLFGEGVNGGLYGDPPDLRNLDDGDLRYSVDFRSVYATVLEEWLGSESAPVLFGEFETLPLFRA